MLKMIERGVLRSEIKLSMPAASISGPTAVASPLVQILRVGKFQHPVYGDLEITAQTLTEMKANFDENVRGIDIAFDYFHESDAEAAGWLTELYLSENDTELWGRVDWTPSAQRKLQEREIRYFSPDFAFEWQNPETGVTYKNVLFGGGLTNRPFVKDMAAIVAAEEREQMKLEELAAQVKKLSEDQGDLKKQHEDLQKAHSALQGEHAELKKKLGENPAPAVADPVEPDEDDMPALKAKLAEMEKKCAEYEEKLKESDKAKVLSEKEAEFTVLLTEGKACAAQKDAYIKGDAKEFAKLAEKTNLSPNGSSSAGGAEGGTRDERVLKLAEQKMKADPKLGKIDAITLANKEVQ